MNKMQKSFFVAVLLGALAFVGTTYSTHRLGIDQLVEGAAPSTQVVQGITTTSGAVFVPLGYNRLSCSSDVYYKVVSASTGTAATTDSLARGPLSVNGITVARPVWINITSNQWLALLNKGGVNAFCAIEQVSVDGLAGAFTDLTASGTATVTGASNLTGLVTTGGAIDAGSLNVVGQATINGAATVAGTVAAAGAATVGTTLGVTGASTLTGGVSVGTGGTAVTKWIAGTVAVTGASHNAGVVASEGTAITITGAAAGQPCEIGLSAVPGNALTYGCYTGSNTCQIYSSNASAGALTSLTGTHSCRVAVP